MSKIVSIDDMHNVVAAIRDHCTVFNDVKLRDHRQLGRVGDKLFAMNFIAVKMATGSCEPIPRYTFDPPQYDGAGGLGIQYRAVVLLLGQCEDQDVRDTTTFLALEQVRTRLALELADGHPAVRQL